MKLRWLFLFLAVQVVVCAAYAETTFTYQGRLGIAGQPAEGNHDFVFRLFDMETNGAQIGSDLAVDAVSVVGGTFTVSLDFGDAPFNSSPRWLEIAVRQASAGMYTTLTPRQRVGASPFAIETLFVAPGSVDTDALQDGSVTQQKIAAGAVNNLQLQNNAVSSSKIADGTITGADINGGLYARKSHIYAATQTLTIGFGIQTVGVSCADANDILVERVCNIPSDASNLAVVAERLTNVHGADLNPATLTCRVENRTPTNPEVITATVWCVAVD